MHKRALVIHSASQKAYERGCGMDTTLVSVLVFILLFLFTGTALSSEQPEDTQITVYVTPNPSLYHRWECSRLSRPREISLSEASSRYRPCSHCRPPIPGLDPTDNQPSPVLLAQAFDTEQLEQTTPQQTPTADRLNLSPNTDTAQLFGQQALAGHDIEKRSLNPWAEATIYVAVTMAILVILVALAEGCLDCSDERAMR